MAQLIPDLLRLGSEGHGFNSLPFPAQATLSLNQPQALSEPNLCILLGLIIFSDTFPLAMTIIFHLDEASGLLIVASAATC